MALNIRSSTSHGIEKDPINTGLERDVTNVVEDLLNSKAGVGLPTEIIASTEKCSDDSQMERHLNCGVTPAQVPRVSAACMQEFSDVFEEARGWIKKVEVSLELVSNSANIKIFLAEFEEFLHTLSTNLLRELKTTAQRFIEHASDLNKHKENSNCSVSDSNKDAEFTSIVTGDKDSSLSKLDAFSTHENLPPSLPKLKVVVFKPEPNENEATTVGDHNYFGAYSPRDENNDVTNDKNDVTDDNNDVNDDNDYVTDDNNDVTDDNNDANDENNDVTDDENDVTDDENDVTDDNNGVTDDNNDVIDDNNEITDDISGDDQGKTKEAMGDEFQCDICFEFFANDEMLARHLETSHMNFENPVVCVKCQATFVLAGPFLEHVKSAHPELNANTCMVCGKSPRGKKNIIRHLEDHIMLYKCDLCDKTFSQRDGLQSHRKSHTEGRRDLDKERSREHSKRQHFNCDSCDRTFRTAAGLKRHVCPRIVDDFPCSHCDKSFSSKAALNYHRRKKVCRGNNSRTKKRKVNPDDIYDNEPDNGSDSDDVSETCVDISAIGGKKTAGPSRGGFVCDICSQEFPTKCDYDIHYSTVHFFGKKALKCPRCNLHPPFNNIVAFTKHVEEVHSEDPKNICLFCDKTIIKHMSRHITRNHLYIYKCDVCEREFGDKFMLISHRRCHSDDYPYQCAVCGKKFRNLDYCKSHEMTAHSSQKTFACHICDERFKQRHNLRFHIDRKHNPNVPFVCEHCGRGCPTKSALARHLFVHVKHQKYQCAVCKKCFAHAAALRHHDESHHGRTEGRWHCNICGKTMLKARKERHLRAHSGARPYVCEICQKSYAWPGLLREHKLTHTTDTPFQCKLCKKVFNNSGNLRKHMKAHHEKS